MKRHPLHTDYFITEEGEVLSSRKETLHKMKPLSNGIGYLRVRICKKGVKKHFYVHRLVAETFIPNPQKKPCVNHINGDKSDNSVNNLEWVSYKENTHHAISQGLWKPSPPKKPKYVYTILIQSTGETFQTSNLRGLWESFRMTRGTFLLSLSSKKTKLPLKILEKRYLS
jgi:hypothetical protein